MKKVGYIMMNIIMFLLLIYRQEEDLYRILEVDKNAT